MSWDGDLRKQVLEAFRDAQRRPGQLEVDAPPARVLVAPFALLVEGHAPTRARRIVARVA